MIPDSMQACYIGLQSPEDKVGLVRSYDNAINIILHVVISEAKPQGKHADLERVQKDYSCPAGQYCIFWQFFFQTPANILRRVNMQ
jgi:hypothetical protein